MCEEDKVVNIKASARRAKSLLGLCTGIEALVGNIFTFALNIAGGGTG